MPTADEFRSVLRSRLRQAELRGVPYLDINAGKLHRELGGYPGPSHQMPVCCDALYAEQQTGDEIIAAPPLGKGASLTIRYQLPRKNS